MAITLNNRKKLRVVVAWLWWCIVALIAQHGNVAALPQKLRFKVTSATTPEDYTKFIKDVRNLVLADGVLHHEIPVLREPSRTPVSDPRRFILLDLSNDREDTVTLAIDATTMYVIGYEAAGISYFFRGDDSPAHAAEYTFPDTQWQTLPFGGGYGALAQQPGGGQRDSIALGREEFSTAISNLRYGTSLGGAFIVVIQMISEAARFRAIEMRVRSHFASGESFMPDSYMVNLENSWDPHSTQVQQSTEGVFQTPVRVQRAPGDFVEYNNVREVIANLALMYFVCRSGPSSREYHQKLIRSVVAQNDDICTEAQPKNVHTTARDGVCLDPNLGEYHNSLIRQEEICTESEPTTHIIGRDGLCVDVRNEQYNNGNPVQLWPCHGRYNQLWNIARDGTIRSNGRCLTTYGYSPGVYVMIYECDKAAVAATKWEIWQNGTIINPESGLVLSANSGSQGTTLTLETNTYTSQQGWLATRNVKPLIVSIMGFRHLCMQADGAEMWLDECASGKEKQKWAIYADGTIRPKQRQDQCLKCDSDSSLTVINIGSCSSGFSGQRWVFTNEGAIMNVNNKLVMDVRAGDPSLHQIILYPLSGNFNQMWVLQP